MSVRVKLKNSTVKDKAPQPTDLEIGEVAINANVDSPAAYIKDSAGNVVKLAGAGAIGGTPASETKAGIVELATAAETTTGTDTTRAVHPAGLKVELDKKAPLASPALTGTPTAPTAAAGTNTTQLATTAFVTAAVSAEDLWDRTGTEITTLTAGDSVFTSGAVKVGGTTAAPNITVKADGGIVANTNGLVYDAATKRLALGTSSPSTLLHLSSATGTATPTPTELRIATTSNANDWSTTTPWGNISFYSADATTGPREHAGIAVITNSSTGGQSSLVFKTASSSSPSEERLRITSIGLVGIGDYAPGSTLTVKGATGVAPLQISGPSSEFCRVASDGKLLVGTSTAVVGSAAKFQCSTTANLAGVAVYADNTAAKAGGLVAGDIYRKADGTLMIAF